jgi:predicted nuclease of predicted toxin-antitoxin system
VKFIVDAQLPPALARWICTRGHEATHIFDLGFHTADDRVIWESAQNDQAVIISKDEDFVD